MQQWQIFVLGGVALFVVLGIVLFFMLRKNQSDKKTRKQEPTLGIEVNCYTGEEASLDTLDAALAEPISTKESPSATTKTVNPSVFIIQIRARPGKPFMGYELLQTVLAAGFYFGEMNLFHRFSQANGKGDLLFSIAAATPSGAFEINNMGAFTCNGLVLFMQLDKVKQLMTTFDLFVDTAKQLAEDLGGELCDERTQSLSANQLTKWREKICSLEKNNLYASDLLDNAL